MDHVYCYNADLRQISFDFFVNNVFSELIESEFNLVCFRFRRISLIGFGPDDKHRKKLSAKDRLRLLF
jgi:hypothetical protein